MISIKEQKCIINNRRYIVTSKHIRDVTKRMTTIYLKHLVKVLRNLSLQGYKLKERDIQRLRGIGYTKDTKVRLRTLKAYESS